MSGQSRLPSAAKIMLALRKAGLSPRLSVDTRNGTWDVFVDDERLSEEVQDVGINQDPATLIARIRNAS